MKFAINYSREAAALLDEGRIRTDLFKCPAWPNLVSEAAGCCDIYVHYALKAGCGGVDADELGRVERLLEVSASPYVNTHLAPNVSDFAGMAMDTRDPGHARRLADAMLRDIGALTDRFGADRVVLENVMWTPWPPFEIPRPALESEVIGRMVRETGCGFILDVAHAGSTARFFGMDEREYIRQLPVDRLREMHVSGAVLRDDGNWMDHRPLTEDDWELTEWAVGQVRSGRWPRPWVTTFEYGGVGGIFEGHSDSETIAEQTPRLYELAKSIDDR